MSVTYKAPIVTRTLDVSYQGSLTTQELQLSFDGPVSFIFPYVLKQFWSLAEAGGLGGSEFAPEDGRCTLVSGASGPTDSAKGKWVWRVSGVSAASLRPLVYLLPIYKAPPGMTITTPRLSLTGSLPITEPARALDAKRVRAWAASSDGLPGAWPDMPFAVRHGAQKKGLAIAITLQNAPSKLVSERLAALAQLWVNGGAWAFPKLSGAMAIGALFLGDKKSWKGTTYSHSFPKAQMFGAAPLALLSNMLRRFHLEVAKVASVELGSPDAPAETGVKATPERAKVAAPSTKRASSKQVAAPVTGGASWDRSALVARVISSLGRKDVPRPRPLPAKQLATLTLPGDRPLPPSMRTWLAFDSEWFFASAKKATWRHEKVSAMLRRMWDLEEDALTEELDAVDAKLPAGGLLLPQSAKQYHVLYLGQVDDSGEHPVLAFEDTPDDYFVKYAGLDTFIADHFGTVKLPREHARLCKAHARGLGL